ncbi:membrane protein insertase YidC [Pseudocnuella soli]|uniref:hypothetical protein n=1 Tax=Pseudocnuella soli TaxID=2502779 RepID=UPI001053E02A|nr:hypothetical protein [Pseudocnuella soli]
MLHLIMDHSGTVILLTLGMIVLYLVIKLAAQAEQTSAKRSELMERVKRLQKKLDGDPADKQQ